MIYRKATMDDAEMLMRWRNDALTVQNFRSNRPVSKVEHEKWLRKAMHGDDRLVFIVARAEGAAEVRPIGAP